MTFFEVIWFGIGLRCVTTSNSVTDFFLAPRERAGVYTNCRNLFLEFIFSRVNTNFSCPCIFRLADRFWLIYVLKIFPYVLTKFVEGVNLIANYCNFSTKLLKMLALYYKILIRS